MLHRTKDEMEQLWCPFFAVARKCGTDRCAGWHKDPLPAADYCIVPGAEKRDGDHLKFIQEEPPRPENVPVEYEWQPSPFAEHYPRTSECYSRWVEPLAMREQRQTGWCQRLEVP